MSKKVVVIGSGFAGLSAATSLAQQGCEVMLIEKNDRPGGRARSFFIDGYNFDMGPSWYWMPDVFEDYFKKFNKQTSDYYNLKRLDPSYRVYFEKGIYEDLPAQMDDLVLLFEKIEKGSGKNLLKFLTEAAFKYEAGMKDLVFKPGLSILEFADLRILKGLFRMDLFKSMRKHVHAHFKHPYLRKLMEFPVLFLGGTPSDTPALYSLMNYADMKLGTWYPMGGMYRIVEAMVSLAREQGVDFKLGENVEGIDIMGGKAVSVRTSKNTYSCDIVVAGADYHHVEKYLLPHKFRSYSDKYWNKRKMAPSSLIFYLGISKKLNGLKHHNLFFDEDFDAHAREIYDTPQWPGKPLFYVSATSLTDPSVAPENCENLFILIPVAPGLKDEPLIIEKYYELIIRRLEMHTSQNIKDYVVVKRTYSHSNFISDYNAFKGNAYGLANTLKQTAFLKPSLKSKKVKNLFYTGQLTVPGPGVPPALISGQVVAEEIIKEFKIKKR